MLTHPTLDQLRELGLEGMIKACGDLQTSNEAGQLSHLEWLALLLEREISHRRDKRLAARLRYAKLRHAACKISTIVAHAASIAPSCSS